MSERFEEDIDRSERNQDAVSILEQVRSESRFPVELGDSGRECDHTTALVDASARVVICGSCNVELDPIKVLYKIAGDASWVRSMREEKRALHQALHTLKCELTKVRGQLRSARKRGGGAS